MRFNEMLEGSRADVSLRFYGKDLQQLLGYVEQAMQVLEALPETSEVQVDALTALRRSPNLNIEFDLANLTKYNVSLPSAQLAISSLLAGERVGSFQDSLWRYPIVMKLDEVTTTQSWEKPPVADAVVILAPPRCLAAKTMRLSAVPFLPSMTKPA